MRRPWRGSAAQGPRPGSNARTTSFSGWRRNTPSAIHTLDNVEPDRELLSLFPARVLLKEELLPLQRLNGIVEVATSRLFATQGLDTLKTLTGLKIKPVLAPTEAIRREMKTHLGVGADTIDTLDEDAPLPGRGRGRARKIPTWKLPPRTLPSSRFVNQVFTDAIELRASDIHLEPFEEEFRIRYRIDGVLQEVPVPAANQALSARHRFARQDPEPSEHRRKTPAAGRPHQDAPGRQRSGHARFRHPDAPRRSGGAALAAPKHGPCMGMDRIGHGPERKSKSSNASSHLPHGIILVTGPTGSGKTTTLYTALNEINDLRNQDHHHRRPHRIPAQGRQPDSGQRKVRADLRPRLALHSAP